MAKHKTHRDIPEFCEDLEGKLLLLRNYVDRHPPYHKIWEELDLLINYVEIIKNQWKEEFPVAGEQ